VFSKSKIFKFLKRDCGTIPVAEIINGKIKICLFKIIILLLSDGWPSRCEDFEKVQLNLKMQPKRFIKHVTSRWLTLLVSDAVERVIYLWRAIQEYFLRYIPKND
jgi:hypothetical protein